MPTVGDVVWARDVRGDYYKALVSGERGEDEGRELRIHFYRWAAKWDEWVAADSDGLQPAQSASSLTPVDSRVDVPAGDGIAGRRGLSQRIAG